MDNFGEAAFNGNKALRINENLPSPESNSDFKEWNAFIGHDGWKRGRKDTHIHDTVVDENSRCPSAATCIIQEEDIKSI